MNYGDVYPSQPNPPICPPQVLISDHSTGLAMSPYHTPLTSPLPPMSPFPAPLTSPYALHGSVGPTTILCTTPASVLPPSPPPVLTSQLPHVFISDHSEVPAPSESRISPAVDANINAPSSGERSEPKSVTIAVRRASEPADVFSSTFVEPRAESAAKSKTRHSLQRLQSSTPTSNQWLKRVVVLVICVSFLALAYKIGSELWEASYGENNSAT